MEAIKQTPNISFNALQETIFAKLTKAGSIVSLLLLANQNVLIEQSTLHGAVWAVEDYINELRALSETLSEKHKNM